MKTVTINGDNYQLPTNWNELSAEHLLAISRMSLLPQSAMEIKVKALFYLLGFTVEKTRERVKQHHRKIYSAELVHAMFSMPFVTPVILGKTLGVNYRTASRYLAELAHGAVLTQSYVGKYHIYANRPLLKLLK